MRERVDVVRLGVCKCVEVVMEGKTNQLLFSFCCFFSLMSEHMFFLKKEKQTKKKSGKTQLKLGKSRARNVRCAEHSMNERRRSTGRFCFGCVCGAL